MMKFYIKLALISIIVLPHSCNFTTNKHKKHINQDSIAPSGIKAFPLDNEVSLMSIRNYLVKDDSTLYLTNPERNYIAVYNIKSGQKTKTIRIPTEGPNSIAPSSGNDICIISDSSFAVFDMWGASISIFSNNRIIRKIDIKDKNLIKRESLNHIKETYTPLSFSISKCIDSTLYVTLFNYKTKSGFDNILAVPINQDSIYSLGQIPEKYCENFYGQTRSLSVATPMLTYKGKSLLINYPIENKLIEVLKGGNEKNHIFESSIFSETSPLDDRSADMNKVETYLSQSKFFTSILYDKYRENTYIFGHLEVPLHIANQQGRTYKDFALIVLDKEYKCIGEYVFEKENDNSRYDFSLPLVLPQGLAIPRKDLYRNNPDSLYFEVFEIKKKEA